MNLTDLNDGSATTKPWLNPVCNNLTCNNLVALTELDVPKIVTTEVDTVVSQTDTLLLNQSALVGVPPVGYSLVYADNTDRLNVASQAFPTRTIAYTSDVPANNKIISPDLSASVECQNGGIIQNTINGDNRLTINADLTYKDPALVDRLLVLSGGYSSLRSSAGTSTRLDIDVTNIYAELQGVPVLYVLGDRTRIWSTDGSTLLNIQNSAGVQINSSYYLPTAGGTNGQVITNDGAGGSSWQNIPVAPPSWVNSYYDPAPLGTVTNVALGLVDVFSEISTVLTINQSDALFDSPANGQLRYVGANPVTCLVSYNISMTCDTAVQELVAQLNKVGVPISGSTGWCFAGILVSCQISCSSLVVTLTTGQYLSINVANHSSAGTNARVLSSNISINIL